MSRKKKKSTEMGKPGVPAYIVTFSDMVTLLLTFFVLLLSMAGTQSASRFKTAQSAFKSEMDCFGISGFMSSKYDVPKLDHAKVKYRSKEGSDVSERSTDSHAEMLRRIILDLEETMKITPSQITCRSKEFNVTDIHFDRGKWDLSGSAKEYLTKYSLSLQESFTGQNPPTIYVVGLAGKERTEKQKWILSARRAQSVADFLRQNLPKDSKWRLYCWGAGGGGQWSNDTGPMNKDAEIMISVLNE
jgi:chemotaxis protein MotB